MRSVWRIAVYALIAAICLAVVRVVFDHFIPHWRQGITLAYVLHVVIFLALYFAATHFAHRLWPSLFLRDSTRKPQ